MQNTQPMAELSSLDRLQRDKTKHQEMVEPADPDEQKLEQKNQGS